jgi:hypothetical protein
MEQGLLNGDTDAGRKFFNDPYFFRPAGPLADFGVLTIYYPPYK